MEMLYNLAAAVDDDAVYSHGRHGEPGRGVKLSIRSGDRQLMKSNTLKKFSAYDVSNAWLSLVPRGKGQTHEDVMKRHIDMLMLHHALGSVARKRRRDESAQVTDEAFGRSFFPVEHADRQLWRADVAAEFLGDVDFGHGPWWKRRSSSPLSSFSESRSNRQVEAGPSTSALAHRRELSPPSAHLQLRAYNPSKRLHWFASWLKAPGNHKQAPRMAEEFSAQYYGEHRGDPIYGVYIPFSPQEGYEMFWCLFLGKAQGLVMWLRPLQG
mmetsp:Transcript_9891/g.28341  ORF Transcript_9891/g.28341 Transcript_9891/m.28341 type:complete len:268 (-) Transcript_9891:158-961(-)